MKDKEYKYAWQRLKEEYIKVYINERKSKNRNIIAEQQISSFLYNMDIKDGTNEFSNLLSDLGDE